MEVVYDFWNLPFDKQYVSPIQQVSGGMYILLASSHSTDSYLGRRKRLSRKALCIASGL